jgi:hypothetical protein
MPARSPQSARSSWAALAAGWLSLATSALSPPASGPAPEPLDADARGRLVAALPRLLERLGSGGANAEEVLGLLGIAASGYVSGGMFAGGGLAGELDTDEPAGDVVELRMRPAAELGLRLGDLEQGLGSWQLLFRAEHSAVAFSGPPGSAGGGRAELEVALAGDPEASTPVHSMRLSMPEPLRRAWVVPRLEGAVGDPRLGGLERIYFQRLGRPGRRLGSPRELDALIPPALAATATAASRREAAGVGGPAIDELDPPALASEDFTMPLAPAGSVVLRQVVDFSHPRIAEQYWALYAEGRLVDLWFFSPLAGRDDGGKVLTPLLVQTVGAGGSGLELRTCGSMQRPQGAWWAHRRDLGFVVDGDEIRLVTVVAPFLAGQGYDLGEIPPIMVFTEEVQGDRIVRRTVDPVPDELLASCGFTSELDCSAMLQAARCVTASPLAQSSSRAPDEPSFAERGGGPEAR